MRDDSPDKDLASLNDDEKAAIQEIYDLAAKIVDDGEVDDDEVAFISGWLERHRQYAGKWPFTTLVRMMTSIMEDGEVDTHEKLQLMSVMSGLSVFSKPAS